LTIFIGGTEVCKYAFFSALGPLYSKQRKKRDMEFGYIKGSVRGYVLGNPGETYNSIRRVLDLPNGTLAYHLKDLEREGIVKAERDGTLKRFYPAEGRVTADVLELSDIQNDIYNTIMDNPGISQKDIQANLGISQQRLNYQIQQMADAMLIRVERDGKKTRCFVVDKNET
jgi:predicted transcriptional regulator